MRLGCSEIKAILFPLLALEAVLAFACADYLYCHCADTDRAQNDTATRAVCDEYKDIHAAENYSPFAF
jgi:hypothetical protein